MGHRPRRFPEGAHGESETKTPQENMEKFMKQSQTEYSAMEQAILQLFSPCVDRAVFLIFVVLVPSLRGHAIEFCSPYVDSARIINLLTTVSQKHKIFALVVGSSVCALLGLIFV